MEKPRKPAGQYLKFNIQCHTLYWTIQGLQTRQYMAQYVASLMYKKFTNTVPIAAPSRWSCTTSLPRCGAGSSTRYTGSCLWCTPSCSVSPPAFPSPSRTSSCRRRTIGGGGDLSSPRGKFPSWSASAMMWIWLGHSKLNSCSGLVRIN